MEVVPFLDAIAPAVPPLLPAKSASVAIGAEQRNRRCGEREVGVLTQRHRGTEGAWMPAADLPVVSCTSHIAISDVGGVCLINRAFFLTDEKCALMNVAGCIG